MAAPRIRTSPTMPVPPKLKPPYTTGATPMGHSPTPTTPGRRGLSSARTNPSSIPTPGRSSK